MKRALVVGAGVAGCSAAVELVHHGLDVTVLEATGLIGGRALSYCCKATDSCSRCGVCVAHEALARAIRHPKIRFITGAAIEKVEKIGKTDRGQGRITVAGRSSRPSLSPRLCIDCRKCLDACPARCISRYSRGGLVQYGIDYAGCRLQNNGTCDACARSCPTGALEADGGASSAFKISADAVLVATGHETFDPAAKPRLGYRRLAGVMTGLEAEKALVQRSDLGGSSVAFIQCVGSRDPALCRNFCSSVCCAYALRMARMLKHRNPSCEVTVYYIDIQNFDKAQRSFRESVEQIGVKLVRGIPSSISRRADGRLHLAIEDPSTGRSDAAHDQVVLSVGMRPADGAEDVAGLFGLERDEFGFFRSSSSSVLAAGTCAEPQGMVEAMASARAAALTLVYGWPTTATPEARQPVGAKQ